MTQRRRKGEPEGTAPVCACGAALTFGTNPMTGVTLESCNTCGTEQPVPVRGCRIYQRVQDERA